MLRWESRWARAGSAPSEVRQEPPGKDVPTARVEISGRFFTSGHTKWYVSGLTYGPFQPNSGGDPFPSVERATADFSHMRRLGASALRVYHTPPRWLLDQA